LLEFSTGAQPVALQARGEFGMDTAKQNPMMTAATL